MESVASSSPRAVVVTGASGFVGRALLERLAHASPLHLGGANWREEIGRASLGNATVFHLAARTHAPGDPETLFENDNVGKSVALAAAAAASGARRFVFLSSIKVNGDETRERPFRPEDPEAPADAYARSKWHAECALRDLCGRAGLPLVILRAPLVVGAGARANLRSLMALADSPWPLPFASIPNRRTFIDVRDLSALLDACGASREAAGSLFLAGHPQSFSTPHLIGILRGAWGRRARLFRMPPRALEMAARAFGSGDRMRRLTRSLEVDVSVTMRELGWTPAVAIERALVDMARAYHRERHA